jgi:hypothetical protein
MEKTMTDRYEVREGSLSRHCCFTASIVDLDRQQFPGIGGELGKKPYQLAECFDIEDAHLIAAALNGVHRLWLASMEQP